MKNLALHIIFIFCLVMAGHKVNGQMDTFAMFGITHQQETAAKKWIDNLYEMGIRMEGDSMLLTEEARRVAMDSDYRTVVYRDPYTWETANYLFSIQQYKIAFWHLINIYTRDPESRENVVKYILTFDNALQMDKALTGAFYTYAFFDPEVAVMTNGKPNVCHPEIMDEKLARVRELVNYIVTYRAQRK